MAIVINLEPVLNEQGELYWLKTETKHISKINSKKSIKKIIEENKPLDEIKEFNLLKQGLWECRKCGGFTQSNPSPPSLCSHCDFKNVSFKPITKTINPDLWKLPKWKDLPVEDLDMLGLYDETLKLNKKMIVLSKEIEYKIFTLWKFSTWKLECWDTVGYPVFIGITNSGKSRALNIIHNLAYRAPKASGVRPAAIPRLCHYYNVTLLIDEAHSKLNPRNDVGSELLNFVKDSYKRGSVYIVCDNNDQEKLVVTRNFGFKAFAGEKKFNPALLTRSLVFWMDKADPEISKLKYVEDDFEKIRTKLLNYRLKTSDPEDLGIDFCLKGRTREIFESIISTGKHIGVKVDDIIKYAKEREKQEEEKLQGSIQCEILSIIKESEENPTLIDAPDRIKTDIILEKLEWLTDDKKANQANRQKLGYILDNIGLDTKRTREGRCLFFCDGDNDSRLKQLYRRYKL